MRAVKSVVAAADHPLSKQLQRAEEDQFSILWGAASNRCVYRLASLALHMCTSPGGQHCLGRSALSCACPLSERPQNVILSKRVGARFCDYRWKQQGVVRDQNMRAVSPVGCIITLRQRRTLSTRAADQRPHPARGIVFSVGIDGLKIVFSTTP